MPGQGQTLGLRELQYQTRLRLYKNDYLRKVDNLLNNVERRQEIRKLELREFSVRGVSERVQSACSPDFNAMLPFYEGEIAKINEKVTKLHTKITKREVQKDKSEGTKSEVKIQHMEVFALPTVEKTEKQEIKSENGREKVEKFHEQTSQEKFDGNLNATEEEFEASGVLGFFGSFLFTRHMKKIMITLFLFMVLATACILSFHYKQKTVGKACHFFNIVF